MKCNSHVIYTNTEAGVLATVVIGSERSIELSSSTVLIPNFQEKDGKLIESETRRQTSKLQDEIQSSLKEVVDTMIPKVKSILEGMEERGKMENDLLEKERKAFEKEEKAKGTSSKK